MINSNKQLAEKLSILDSAMDDIQIMQKQIKEGALGQDSVPDLHLLQNYASYTLNEVSVYMKKLEDELKQSKRNLTKTKCQGN